MTSGFGNRRSLAPRHSASHAIRVPRVRSLPTASFRSHLAVDTLAVRLGVPVIKASKGLSPSSHFPVGFRLPVASASHGATRHAWRTSGKGVTSRPLPPLRTAHDSFPSRRSSLSRASRLTRFLRPSHHLNHQLRPSATAPFHANGLTRREPCRRAK